MSQQVQKFQQQLIDNLHTSVLLFDAGLNLVYANPAAEVLFAMSLRRLLGKQGVTGSKGVLSFTTPWLNPDSQLTLIDSRQS